MNTLVLLLMTAVPGAEPPVLQPQPVLQAPSASVAPADTGESSWWNRFRSRPGLLSRMRARFGRSPSADANPAVGTVPYPGSVTLPPTTSSGRLVPMPVDTPAVSTAAPQPMPVGR
jgi:hypothetical protein